MTNARNTKKRSERYISYNVSETESGEYKITINYFIDKGYPIYDVDFRRIKYITCSEQELTDQEKKIQNVINRTKYCLTRALHKVGANEANVYAFIRKKMR